MEIEAPFDGLLTLSGADRCGACVLGIFCSSLCNVFVGENDTSKLVRRLEF